MSRARRPTEDAATGIYDRERRAALGVASASPPAAGSSVGSSGAGSLEHDPTEVTAPPSPERATPTELAPPPAPMEVPRPERSEPVRVISMKDQLGGAGPEPGAAAAHRPLPAVKLRSLAEVSGRHPTPVSLGRLAPPRNARESHARRVRSNVGWAGLALALAAAIALAIWLVAR